MGTFQIRNIEMSSGTSWWLDQIGRFPLLTPAQEIALGTAIQTWLNHPDFPDGCPAAIRRRGQRAREQFVRANLRLAVSYVTKRCQRLSKTHSHDDLIQAANEGLIAAVERFDPTRGYRFSTYAYWWIRQSVNRWVDRHGRAIAIPVLHHQQLYRLQLLRREYMQRCSRHPTREELLEGLGISPRTLDQLLENAIPIASLDFEVETGDGSTQFLELLAAADSTMEEHLEQCEQVEQLLERLPPKDQELVNVTYGLDGIIRSRQEAADELQIPLRQLSARLIGIERRLKLRPMTMTGTPRECITDGEQLSLFT